MPEIQHLTHAFPPFYDEKSTWLILGSFPSVKSREQQFYYGHPQNRFWKVLSALTMEACPQTLPVKQDFLRRNRIALWDVIEECDIKGSSDSSIRNVIPTDLSRILSRADINTISLNGKTASRLFAQYHRSTLDAFLSEKSSEESRRFRISTLPSTSPANAAWSLERLIAAWETASLREHHAKTSK